MPPLVAEDYGIVLLAAGKSSRLGQPKQFLVFGNKSLVKKAARTALEITGKVIVVTGAFKEKVEGELSGLPIDVVYNKDYEEGIASSIRTGLSSLIKKFGDIKGVIFIVCDQPYLNSSVLKQLIDKTTEPNNTIVAAIYAGTVGTPVLFMRTFFQNLLELKGDNGAKKIIKEHINDVGTIDFPQGEIDIDTMEDYDSIKNKL